eukprot:scaffold474620_cov33-Prasinocladus_malaysianus.AAC.1
MFESYSQLNGRDLPVIFVPILGSTPIYQHCDSASTLQPSTAIKLPITLSGMHKPAICRRALLALQRGAPQHTTRSIR